jgi:hypothetical protein
MRYYDPRIQAAILKKYFPRIGRSPKEAESLYFNLGMLLYSRDMYNPATGEYLDLPFSREVALYIRRGLEERFPELRVKEAAERRRHGRRTTMSALDEIFVQYDPLLESGTIIIPNIDSRFNRRIPFLNVEHFKAVIAALVVEGQVDPFTLTVNTGSSAIPYLQFIDAG